MTDLKIQTTLPPLTPDSLHQKDELALPFECSCKKSECFYQKYLQEQALVKKLKAELEKKETFQKEVQPIQLHQPITVTVNNGSSESWRKTLLKLACGAVLGVLSVNYGPQLANKAVSYATNQIGSVIASAVVGTVVAPITGAIGSLSSLVTSNSATTTPITVEASPPTADVPTFAQQSNKTAIIEFPNTLLTTIRNIPIRA